MTNTILECTHKLILSKIRFFEGDLKEIQAAIQADTEIQDTASLNIEINRIEMAIKKLHQLISRKEVLVPTDQEETCQLGSYITTTFGGKPKIFFMDTTAEIGKFAIDIDSPFGQTLLGKKVGDSFNWETPKGSVRVIVKKLDPYSTAKSLLKKQEQAIN